MLFCSEEKPIRREKTKLQATTIMSFGSEVCSPSVIFIVISQYTVDLSESNQSVHGFLIRTVNLLFFSFLTLDVSVPLIIGAKKSAAETRTCFSV